MRFGSFCVGAIIALMAISTAKAQSRQRASRPAYSKTPARSSQVRRANFDGESTVEVGSDLVNMSDATYSGGCNEGCRGGCVSCQACGGNGDCAGCGSDYGCHSCRGMGKDCWCKLGQKKQYVPYPRCFSFKSPCLDDQCGCDPCCKTIFGEMACDLRDWMDRLKGCGGHGCPERPFGFRDCGCSDGCSECSGGCDSCSECIEPECGIQSTCIEPECGIQTTCCEPECGISSTCCEPECGFESVGCSSGCSAGILPGCGCGQIGCTGGCGGGLLKGLTGKLFGCGCSGGCCCSNDGCYGGGDVFMGSCEGCNSHQRWAAAGPRDRSLKYYATDDASTRNPTYLSSKQMAARRAILASESNSAEDTEVASPPRTDVGPQAKRSARSEVRPAGHEQRSPRSTGRSSSEPTRRPSRRRFE